MITEETRVKSNNYYLEKLAAMKKIITTSTGLHQMFAGINQTIKIAIESNGVPPEINGEHDTWVHIEEVKDLHGQLVEAHNMINEFVSEINDNNNGDRGTVCEIRLLRMTSELQVKHGVARG